MTELLIQIQPEQVCARLAKSENNAIVPLQVTKYEDFFEVDPQAIWNAVTKCIKILLTGAKIPADRISAVEISCELDITVLWDNETLGAVCAARGDSSTPTHRLAWLIEHNPAVVGTMAAGRLNSGSAVDYLISRMTRGLFSDDSGIGMTTEPSGFLGISAQIIA